MDATAARLNTLFVVAFVDMVGLVMILPLLPFYAEDLGANATMVGLLVSSFAVAQLLVAPLWGRMSDRYGRRPAILLGLGITAVSYVVFAFADSVAVLFLSRLVQGIGGGTIGVVHAYVADASPPEQRTKSLGWLSAVTSLGAVAGPAFGSGVDALLGPRGPGLAAAGLATLTMLFAWRYLAESRGMRPAEPHVHPERRVTGRGAVVQVAFRWSEPAPRLIWIYAVAIGASYGLGPLMPLLLAERFRLNEHTTGYVFMYFGLMGVVVRAGLLGRLVDALGEAKLSRVGVLSLAAGIALTATARSWAVLVGGLTLWPVGMALLFPCVSGLLSRVVPAGQRGLYMGVQQTFGGLSRVAFPIAAGVLMDTLGRSTPFALAAGLVALLVLVMRPLGEYERQV